MTYEQYYSERVQQLKQVISSVFEDSITLATEKFSFSARGYFELVYYHQERDYSIIIKNEFRTYDVEILDKEGGKASLRQIEPLSTSLDNEQAMRINFQKLYHLIGQQGLRFYIFEENRTYRKDKEGLVEVEDYYTEFVKKIEMPYDREYYDSLVFYIKEKVLRTFSTDMVLMSELRKFDRKGYLELRYHFLPLDYTIIIRNSVEVSTIFIQDREGAGNYLDEIVSHSTKFCRKDLGQAIIILKNVLKENDFNLYIYKGSDIYRKNRHGIVQIESKLNEPPPRKPTAFMHLKSVISHLLWK